jgi:hypothetical protein
MQLLVCVISLTIESFAWNGIDGKNFGNLLL